MGLIKREKVFEHIKAVCLEGDGGALITSEDFLKMAIKDIPSAEKQGEWMPIIEANEFGDVYQSGIYCSECGETLRCEANFCPNCGARMFPTQMSESSRKGADDE